MPEGTDRKKISQWLILGRGQPAGKEVQYPWLHPWYQAGLVSGVLKKSYFTPKPPKGGFLNYWISISPPSPSRSRFGGARPGGFRGVTAKIDFFNNPLWGLGLGDCSLVVGGRNGPPKLCS